MVAHDRSLERVTAGADCRLVEDVGLAELRSIRLAGGARVPTLQQVLRLCQQRGLVLNVEMKNDVPNRVAATRAAADTLKQAPQPLPLLVSSFDPLMLLGFAQLCPHLPCGMLLHDTHMRYQLGRIMPRFGIAAVHVDHRLITRRWVRRWHANGLLVIAWTVNDVDQLRRLHDLAVDGFICDDPAAAGATLNGLARVNSA